jgi:thiamine biosynthesis lipoprotein
VAEWSKALDWNSSNIQKVFVGSNPTLSANQSRRPSRGVDRRKSPLMAAHHRFLPLLAGLLVLAPLGGCRRPPPAEHFNGETMGTTYSVTITALPQGVSRERIQSTIDDILSDIDRHLSTYDPASEISRFNASESTVAVPVSAELGAVVAIAQSVSEASGGAFDATVGPLVRAWGFGENAQAMPAAPDAEMLARLRSTTGYTRLRLSDHDRTLTKAVPELQLDVAGIAPGYAVDLIARRFELLGVSDFLVELGGEVRAKGRSPAGRPWRVAVEAPLAGERRPYAIVELDGAGTSTSGDYRDFRIVDGRRISHTIDPRTGEPVTNRLASVCVVHPSAAYADAYATALMVLGAEEGMKLAQRLNLAALFIVREGDDAGFKEQSTAAFTRLRRPLD